MAIPAIDAWALSTSAGILQRFPALDDLAVLLARNDFTKGALLLGLLWWIWARPGADQDRRREIVIATFVAAMLAGTVSRGIAVLVPFRPRPINMPDVGMYVDPRILDWERGHGSFPSDHAALAFALATGILVASRGAGILALAWAALAVSLPRVYLGIHWLTDVLGGAAIGAVTTVVLTRTDALQYVARPIRRFVDRHPGVSYAGLFLVSYGLMTRFHDVRALAKWVLYAVRVGKFPIPGN
jgi:undecaprenyl-diphosphatase